MVEEEIVMGICAGGSHRHAALRAWITGSVGARMQRFFISHGIASQDAEDVLQNTIINVVTKAHTYRADGAARSWLWQIARNCMTDFFRRSDGYIREPDADQVSDSERLAAANDADVSIKDGIRVIKFPYIENVEESREGSNVSRQVYLEEEQWQALRDPAAYVPGEGEIESADECFDRGMDAFISEMPERGLALNMQMDGASIAEIAEELGRTVGATKEFLSQCRKHLQPFVAHCAELLSH